MNCEELAQLIPDLIDGSLPADILADAQATLPQCPECQQQLEIARQVRTFLIALQAENPQLRVPPGFQANLLVRIQQQNSSLELLDLSSKAFFAWLVELINLLGGLINPASSIRSTSEQPGTA